MKKKIIILLVLLSPVFAYLNVYGQHPPCKPDYPGLTFSLAYLPSFPLYSTSMPFDVLLGYVAMDTVCNYGSAYEMYYFINRQDYNDTLKTLMKYLYILKDYDPVLFYRSINFVDTNNYIQPYDIYYEFMKKLVKVSPKSMIDELFCTTDIIAQVRIIDTLSIIDTTAKGGAGKLKIEVTCEIVDTIKGKVVPECKNHIHLKKEQLQTGQPAQSGTCLQFIYCPAWSRNGRYNDGYTRYGLRDSTGAAWIKPNKEYIVFLDFTPVCWTDTDMYFTIRPEGPNSGTFLMYPIDDNGIVYDPLDDFGFGQGLTASEFKTKLRELINSIRYFVVE